MKRIYGLDIVRSIAILVVVVAHSPLPQSISGPLQSIVPGEVGVSIFFVLSGYLIGGILLKSIDADFSWRDLGQFWIRRWFRTLPNYFLVLIFLVIYDWYVFKTDIGLSYQFFFFLQNIGLQQFWLFPESWSLSVEEWFYLLFPLLCFLGFKLTSNKRSVILILACLFLVMPTVLRYLVYLSGDADDIHVAPYVVICRLDGIMYGIIGAYFNKYYPQRWLRMKSPGLLVAFGVLLFTIIVNLYFITPSWFVVYYSLLGVMTLAALPYFSSLMNGNRSLVKLFTYISVTSYSIYVLNLSVIQVRIVPAFMSVTGLDDLAVDYQLLVRLVLYLIGTIVGSYLLYRFFEKPMTDLRDKIVIDKKTVVP